LIWSWYGDKLEMNRGRISKWNEMKFITEMETKRNGDLDESLDKNFHLNPHSGW
jgi:hypothetical protein